MILGLNARELGYIAPSNPPDAIRRIAHDKVAAKALLHSAGLPVADTLATLRTHADVRGFDWNSLPAAFALKPAGGGRGCGIVVVAGRDGPGWVGVSGERVTAEQLQFHAHDVLDGAFSREGRSHDVAFVEERLSSALDLTGAPALGLPDVRVIVYRGTPVLAMTRLPTRESNGKANLHQGAIGLGIDLATGRTTHAVHHGKTCEHHPDTGRPIAGLLVPEWERVLSCAVRAQELSGLGYAGIDLVHADGRGLRILEINARPGLDIQIANRLGLAELLARVG